MTKCRAGRGRREWSSRLEGGGDFELASEFVARSDCVSWTLWSLDIPLVGATPSLSVTQALLLLPTGLSKIVVMGGHKVVSQFRRANPVTRLEGTLRNRSSLSPLFQYPYLIYPLHTDNDLYTALSNRCMSHTPTTTAPPGNAPLPPATGTTAQQDKDKKPSLTGVRIKQRKRQAQAASKFEPEGG